MIESLSYPRGRGLRVKECAFGEWLRPHESSGQRDRAGSEPSVLANTANPMINHLVLE
jgi:hypothetical protein